MEVMKRWECCDGLPITHYLDSVDKTGTSLFFEEDLFKVPVAVPVKYVYPYGNQCRRKVRQGNGFGTEKRQIKQGRFESSISVDEDLYKIPPELLYQKNKRKKHLRKLLSGCMNLNCVR